MKECSKCQITKSDDHFAVKSKKTGRLQSYCKECSRKYHREHYQANKATYLKNNAARKKVLMEYVHELKDNPCTDCGNKFHPWAMHFDHLRDKDLEIAKLVAYGSKKRIDSEVKKCELVCSNCHAVRTYTRKYAGVC